MAAAAAAAAADGYAVIRNVIPADLAHKAAASIPGTLKVREVYESVTEYDPRNHDDDPENHDGDPKNPDDDPQNRGKPKPPSFGEQIRNHFVNKADKTVLLRLLNRASGENLVLTSVGVFHQPKAKPTEIKHGLQGTVYVTIAVTDLNAESGWFTFFKGSHRRDRSLADCDSVDLRMNAGDAVVWSGDLRYINSSGSGGKFVTLTYQ